MATIAPRYKPNLSAEELHGLLKPFQIDRGEHPVVVVGLRGYYKDIMGAPGVNDRGIYDDAIFIDSPSITASFNANTDPSKYRKGHGFDEGKKGMASLKPGYWPVYKFDKHKKKYLALCQRGRVTVIRDGDPPYEDTGEGFGINIHKGGLTSTSSEGCQTIHPDQWKAFIETVIDQAKRYHQKEGETWEHLKDRLVIPYILIDVT